ncbi:MAG TPA: SpoIVB peptidase S55, partial [Myxococcota bacterium]|nr:SpoIVB peptidase S55 [Myxococcota bacterium]
MAWLLAASLALPPVFLPSDVERGQKGECQTVFEGNEIEPFQFEVKGLMKNFLGPGRDLVLARLLGEKPNFTGVVAGMS